MKLVISIVLLTFVTSIFGQSDIEYKSSEQDKYYKQRRFKSFKRISENKIRNYHSDYFDILEIDEYKAFDKELFFTAFQDSVYNEMFVRVPKPPKINTERDFIGKVNKSAILKYSKKDSLHVFIYSNFQLQDIDFGEPGLWIAISRNNGVDWNYYYTGIVQRQPLYLKWYSQLPMIIDNENIQIEAVLLQQQNPFIHPGPLPDYKVVKDGIKIVFDINQLVKDSDKDGLTDILEKALHTNYDNPDTDNDGITDALDLNPRYISNQSDLTVIYETLLNEYIPWDTIGIEIESKVIPIELYKEDSMQTVLIVTDNLDLLRIQPKKHRVIFLTKKEYEKNRPIFKTDLNKMNITPLFKVDGYTDTFIISKSFGTGGEEYLVKKTKKGWSIKLISAWIS